MPVIARFCVAKSWQSTTLDRLESRELGGFYFWQKQKVAKTFALDTSRCRAQYDEWEQFALRADFIFWIASAFATPRNDE